MRVFINPGHAPGGNPDPGAVNSVTGLRECDVAKNIANLVAKYLTAAGVEVVSIFQNDSLAEIANASNRMQPDIFVSIHCNAFNCSAHGTEVWHFHSSQLGRKLAECIQNQIIDALGTTNPSDEEILRTRQDDFARAIARGITDYELEIG